MKRSIKFALMALASPLVIEASLSNIVPNFYIVNASEQEAHTNGSDTKDSDEHGDSGVIKMTKAEQKIAGVVTTHAAFRGLAETVLAPGEVTVNQYTTFQITPRIEAQIIARHVRMGDAVKSGQRLVTLSSVEMAEAQGNLILSEIEWRRTQKLGRDVVSEQRYIEAQIRAQQAKAKVLAYGMTEVQLQKFLSKGNAATAIGEFDLVAGQAGTIISDNFIIGQFVEPGNPLLTVSDENQIWVEAKLPPDIATNIQLGSQAWILEDDNRLAGVVVQVHHIVDEKTRTLAVRIQLANAADVMHAGEFVNVAIKTGEGAPLLAVPNKSIVLLNGKQVVFKREGEQLIPTPINVGLSKDGWTEIKSGISAGDEIVIENTFTLKSLLLKSSIGDDH